MGKINYSLPNSVKLILTMILYVVLAEISLIAWSAHVVVKDTLFALISWAFT